MKFLLDLKKYSRINVLANNRLIGVFKMPDGKIITLRTADNFLCLCGVDASGTESPFEHGFVAKTAELGHMAIDTPLQGHSLGLKSVSRAERNMRALNKGKHVFISAKIFNEFFGNLGYSLRRAVNANLIELEKSGKYQPKDNLDSFYRIEAIDPKTGKARIFTFPIQKTSGN